MAEENADVSADEVKATQTEARPEAVIASAEDIRQLWEWGCHEDNLLVARTGALVSMEALVIAACAFLYADEPAPTRAWALVILAVIGIVTCTTWILCYVMHRVSKGRLHKALNALWVDRDPPIEPDGTRLIAAAYRERYRGFYAHRGRFLGPSGWYGAVLPVLLTAAWIGLILVVLPHVA